MRATPALMPATALRLVLPEPLGTLRVILGRITQATRIESIMLPLLTPLSPAPALVMLVSTIMLRPKRLLMVVTQM